MTEILTQIGKDREISKTFSANADIAFGLPVAMSSANTVDVATASNAIGWAVPDDVVAASNSDLAEEYKSGELVNVKLKGEVLQVTAGVGGVAVGDFVKLGTGGKYIEDSSKTLDTQGVALTAASADGLFEMVRFE